MQVQYHSEYQIDKSKVQNNIKNKIMRTGIFQENAFKYSNFKKTKLKLDSTKSHNHIKNSNNPS